MDKIEGVYSEPLVQSRFVKPYLMHYKQVTIMIFMYDANTNYFERLDCNQLGRMNIAVILCIH